MSGDDRYSEAEREEVEKATMEHLEVITLTSFSLVIAVLLGVGGHGHLGNRSSRTDGFPTLSP